MNKAQRDRLQLIAKELNTLINSLENQISLVKEIAGEEQEKFDNLPEGLQASPTGERLEEVICTLTSGIDEAESAIEGIRTLISACKEP